MLYIRNIFMVLAMSAVSFTTSAQEVYENVDEKGVVEFSDTPTPGSKAIEVNPNVVEVTPVKPVARPAAESAARPEAAEAPARQSEELYSEDNRIRNEERLEEKERSERREPRDEVSRRPATEHRVEGGGAGRTRSGGGR